MKSFVLILAWVSALIASPAWEQNVSTRTVQAMSLDQLLAEVKASTDALRSASFAQAVGEYQPKTIADVRSLLDATKDDQIAPYAQMSISKSTDPALGPALHEALKAQLPVTKNVTDVSLKKLPPEAQTKAMLQAMSMAAVVHALGATKYQPAVPELRELLGHDQEFEGYLAWEASKALGDLGDEQSMQAIMRTASQGKAVTLSGFKVRGIRKIVERVDELDASFKTNPRKISDPRGIEISDLRDQLGWMGRKDPEVKRALRELLRHPNEFINDGASEALVKSIEPQDKDITLEMLRHRSGLVRLSGLHSLGEAKTWDKSFMPILIDMMQHDPAWDVRHSAVDTLFGLPGWGVRRKELQDAVPYLDALLRDKNKGLQYAAFNALRSITGRFSPYEGMDSVDKKIMEVEPAYKPEPGENESKTRKP